MFAQLSSVSETLKPSHAVKSNNAGEGEQYCASMQSMFIEILSRLQELACDTRLASLGKQSIDIGFDIFNTRIYLGKQFALSEDN